ncbi:GNAT family N-acetyltransferase [Muricoccus radiodurans]|uniref:GNAT family N-acetyltransferase n=1 Tax=Muricoccus radiodurans TaxID=2231721 RepID=UPI003CE6EA81
MTSIDVGPDHALRIEFTAGPEPSEAEQVTAGLTTHLRESLRLKEGPLPITLILKDSSGAVRGGIRAEYGLDWLHVDHFWVDEALRGQGHGARLLAIAEKAARDRGAVGVHLTTSTWQAPDFYAKQGYQEIGRLRGRPAGHDRIWFAKWF